MGDLFGGGSSKKTKQKTTTELRPEQQQLIGSAMPHLTSYAGAPPPAPTTVAPMNADQLAAQEAARAAAGQQAGTSAAATGGTNFLASGDVLKAESNPYLNDYISAATRPIVEATMEQALPASRGEADMTGQFSGTRRALVETGIARDMGRNIGDTTAKILADAYGQGLGAMTKGIALAPQTQGMQTGAASTIAGIGDANQAQAERELAQANLQGQWPLLVGKEILGASNMIPAAGSTTIASPTSQGIGPVQGAIGGAALGNSIVPGGYGAAGGAAAGTLLSLFS